MRCSIAMRQCTAEPRPCTFRYSSEPFQLVRLGAASIHRDHSDKFIYVGPPPEQPLVSAHVACGVQPRHYFLVHLIRLATQHGSTKHGLSALFGGYAAHQHHPDLDNLSAATRQECHSPLR